MTIATVEFAAFPPSRVAAVTLIRVEISALATEALLSASGLSITTRTVVVVGAALQLGVAPRKVLLKTHF